MRKLAQRLGVEAMSLYTHVESKADLVAGIADLVVGEIELPKGEGAWDEAVRASAHSAHDAYRRHPWACGVVMAPSPVRLTESPRLHYIEWLLGRLRRAGFSPELAYHAYHAIDSHVLGFTMWELGHAVGTDDLSGLMASILDELRAHGFHYLVEHAEEHFKERDDADTEFGFGLELVLDGLRASLEASGAT
jgi:hypothetical protein